MNYEPKRLGIHKGWKRRWQTTCKEGESERALEQEANRKTDLIDFSQTGMITIPVEYRNRKSTLVNPPRARWESTYLDSNLGGYFHASEFGFERAMIAGASSLGLIGDVFAAHYLSPVPSQSPAAGGINSTPLLISMGT